LDGFADGPSVFHYWLLSGQVSHRDFVTQGDIGDKLYFADRFAFEGDSPNGSAFLQIHNGDADIILRFMQQNSVFHISADGLTPAGCFGNSFLSSHEFKQGAI